MITHFRRWLLSSPIRDLDPTVETKQKGLEKLGTAVKHLTAVSHALTIETRHCPFSRIMRHQPQRSK